MAMFAKYDGVDGESVDARHDKWIDVLSLDWGVHKPGPGSSGQSRRRGAAVVEDMVLTFEYDKASPKLLEKCLKGEAIPQLEVELTATFGGSRVTYLSYVVQNVMITSYQVEAFGDDEVGPPVVAVANNFEEVKVTYAEFGNDGSSKGNVETEYTVERATSATEEPKKKGKSKKKSKKK